MNENEGKHLVFVVGAGPAGLFATRELASQGIAVVLLNRDIKPGGLAEYGIYPDKHKMKDGLRAQFRPIITLENVRYYANILIGRDGDFTLEDLKAMGAQAILVTAGAQGTKWLGLPGEELNGVYHAKDIVYHYNRLPPFSRKDFRIGRRVAVVGVGNVMTDIAEWLIVEKKVERILAIARRGPGEVKFDKKELERVAANLDYEALDEEIARVTPIMQAVGEDPEVPRHLIRSALERAQPNEARTRFTLHFLASPARILGDAQGNVTGLEVDENTLVKDATGEIKARSLGTRRVFDVDTVIFAIGDRVDESLGLPLKGTEYSKNVSPRFPVEGTSFEVDVTEGRFEGVFVAGWSRKASTGLVGIARKDGINGARAVLEYLDSVPDLQGLPLDEIDRRMHALSHPVVTSEDIAHLLAAEEAHGREIGIDHFKYDSNEEMLRAMGLIKTEAK